MTKPKASFYLEGFDFKLVWLKGFMWCTELYDPLVSHLKFWSWDKSAKAFRTVLDRTFEG